MMEVKLFFILASASFIIRRSHSEIAESSWPEFMASNGPNDFIKDHASGLQNKSRPKRVVRGEEVAQKALYPFMAALVRRGEDGKHACQVTCGASVITDRHVITAAHCVPLHPSSYAVIAGMRYIDDCGRGKVEVRGVVKIDKERGYTESDYIHDLAILHLERPFRLQLGSSIDRICLHQPGINLSNQKPIVLGWGAVTENAASYSKLLKKAKLSVITHDECTIKHKVKAMKDFQFCATHDTGIPCKGDSGGPAIVFNNLLGKYLLVGVLSKGHRDSCDGSVPTIYTFTPKYAPWISTITSRSYCTS